MKFFFSLLDHLLRLLAQLGDVFPLQDLDQGLDDGDRLHHILESLDPGVYILWEN